MFILKENATSKLVLIAALVLALVVGLVGFSGSAQARVRPPKSEPASLLCKQKQPCGAAASQSELALTVLLEGPLYAQSSVALPAMAQGLFDQGVVPLTDPYLGTVTVTSLPATTVDWVLVDISYLTDPGVPVLQLPAILHRDGSVTDALGDPLSLDDFEFWNGSVTPASVSIGHRTHASASTYHWLTPGWLPLSPGVLNTADLIAPTSPGECRNPSFKLVSVIDGEVCVLYAGDTSSPAEPTGDDTIDGDDKALWVANNGNFGLYHSADFNLDADINGADKALWQPNNGIFTG